MKNKDTSSTTPLWFKVLLLIAALPLVAMPWLMRQATMTFGDSSENPTPWVFIMLLPFYVMLSTWISYRIYSHWKALAWILQVLQMLTYVALWVLVQYGSGIV